MAILVTGGAGYIGSHLCVELLNAGYELIVVDNFSNSHPEALKRVSKLTEKSFATYSISLLDEQKLKQIFAKHPIEAVIHLAGLKAVEESVKEPLMYYQHNLTSTFVLCNVMKQYGVKKMVFSSSATVYGKNKQVPITEKTPLGAINPYGKTKEIIEQVLGDLYGSDASWSIAILRYFNPVGAHESGLIGEDSRGIPSNLMPYLSQVAIGELSHLDVYGNDYPTVDGTGVRDYIHVVDLAIGHIKAMEKVRNQTGIHTYNLGTGKGYSVLELVAAFQLASKKNIPFRTTNRRSGDTAICFADVTKAEKELNWSALRGIDEICKDTWNWQKLNPNGYTTQSVQKIILSE
ncbi:UDP-glucose 4-epimerase GalE [Priestia flexa]|uniref:UDP-glucose 4-epimerase GalE n=1 Tax=Priestia flexa TaxID=86664 RepID=UPI002E23EE90|nr:UDP-glucose 4-epimerase GalE [Priestia flexa]MED3824205.1 UDP-glucose 4-epimerase GalE [Priestia flexa]